MAEEDTVFLYFQHRLGIYSDGYSLYGVNISRSNERGLVVNPPLLLLRLDFKKRSGMACAKLGSKFYFLGGYNLIDDTLRDYVSDVMVYDTADSEISQKQVTYRATEGKPMNCGKSKPLTFEANGKLYVLGGYGFRDFFRDSDIPLFEEYDPENDCWTILENPPVGDSRWPFAWWQSFVISPTDILISGSFDDVLFSFNPQIRKWTTVEMPDKIISVYPLLVDGCFYGVGDCAGTVRRYGPFSSLDVPPIDQVAIDWGDFESPREMMLASSNICYLGDGIFCAIDTAPKSIPIPKTYNNYEFDPYLRLFNLIIYKNIRGDPSGNELKCLDLASWDVPTDFNSLGGLVSCHVMRTEKKDRRIQVDDKRTEIDEEKDKRIQVDDGKIDADLKKKKKRRRKKKIAQLNDLNNGTKLELKRTGVSERGVQGSYGHLTLFSYILFCLFILFWFTLYLSVTKAWNKSFLFSSFFMFFYFPFC